MKTMTTRTFVYAALTVLAVVAFFLRPLSVAILAAGLASIDGALLLVMWWSSVSVDAPFFLCLTMSVGFSVDYGVHVAHAYKHDGHDRDHDDADARSVTERLTNALCGVGKSVAKGGASTFTGIFVLASKYLLIKRRKSNGI